MWLLGECWNYQACILARIPLTMCLPYSAVKSCNLPSWWPSSEWLHPAWLWLVHMWVDCCHYVHQRSTHTSTHEISQPLPTWGWETLTCVLSSGIKPCSSFYWHRLSLLWCHLLKFDRGQPPNQCHIHQYEAWNGLVKSAYARIGAMVQSFFRSSKACWHLLSHLMAGFFLLPFLPDVNSCRGHATCANIGMNLQ